MLFYTSTSFGPYFLMITSGCSSVCHTPVKCILMSRPCTTEVMGVFLYIQIPQSDVWSKKSIKPVFRVNSTAEHITYFYGLFNQLNLLSIQRISINRTQIPQIYPSFEIIQQFLVYWVGIVLCVVDIYDVLFISFGHINHLVLFLWLDEPISTSAANIMWISTN